MAQVQQRKPSGVHYLKGELYALVRSDPSIFDFIQKASLDGLWYWDLEHPENEWMNPRFWTLLGIDPATRQHLASEWQDLIFPEDLALALENFQKHCADPSHPYDQVVRYRHVDGSTVWVRCRGIAIRDANGKPVRMLGAHNDLTELKRTEELLRQQTAELTRARDELHLLASHDDLTGLKNRRAVMENLNWLVTHSLRHQLPAVVLMLDIDHFKKINDSAGHATGDRVLKAFADVLREHTRKDDFVGRLGGEEFVVGMGAMSLAEALSSAERIRRATEQLEVNGVKLTVSIGAAALSQAAGAADETKLTDQWLVSADQQLYRAKHEGRNRVCHVPERLSGRAAQELARQQGARISTGPSVSDD